MAFGFTTLEKIIGDTYTDGITAGQRPLWCKYHDPLIYSRHRRDGLTGSIAWESVFVAQQRFKWDPSSSFKSKTISEAFSEWGIRTKQTELVKEWIPTEFVSNGKSEFQAVKREEFLKHAGRCGDCRLEECIQVAFTKGPITLCLPEPRNPSVRIRFHQDIVMEAVVNPVGISMDRAITLIKDMDMLLDIGRTIETLCSNKKSAVNGG